MTKCEIAIIGAGPYGLSAAAYLKAAGIDTRVFGEPMAFWENHMPAGMLLRSNWKASDIADPDHELTLDAYREFSGNHLSSPVPVERFVDYGRWYQRQLVPDLDRRIVSSLTTDESWFKLILSDGESFKCKRVVIAAGIGAFFWRPSEFDGLPSVLASHTSEHRDLSRFKGQHVIVIGGGQSALESAALLHETGTDVEVLARQKTLNWVGLHSWLHKLGPISRVLYSSRDVGPAGLSRIVAAPRVLQMFPRAFQERASYRSIRPAGIQWLLPRLTQVPITLGRKVVSAIPTGNQLRLRLDDGTDRMVDHVLLATGYRVNIRHYNFLSQELQAKLQCVEGYPVLRRGLESSITGLHFLGKPAAWSFGPLLCFVSGAEFAANELVRTVIRKNGLR